MKCQECAEEATVHYTELEGAEPRFLDFCNAHAKVYVREKSHLSIEEDLLDELTAVDVEVTQSQLDKEGWLTVDLPDGRTAKLKLCKEMSPAWRIRQIRRREGAPAKPLYEFRIKLVPEYEK